MSKTWKRIDEEVADFKAHRCFPLKLIYRFYIMQLASQEYCLHKYSASVELGFFSDLFIFL